MAKRRNSKSIYYEKEGVVYLTETDVLLDYFGVKKIASNKNYWLVRTQSGEFFHDFHLGGYVAFGWDKMNDLKLITSENRERLKEKIGDLYPEEKQSGRISNQLIRFTREMKKGDIVVIPSKNSTYIAIGEIMGDVYLIDEGTATKYEEDDRCYFRKRRKVKWYKHFEKDNLDIYLHKLLNSHHAITNANDYASFIDRSLYRFFVKDGQTHVVFEVEETRDIHAIDLVTLISNILRSVDIFNELTDNNLDKNEINMKINVNSPGPVEFAGTVVTVCIVGIVVIALVGGKFKFEFSKEVKKGEISSEGLIEKVMKFYELVKNNETEDPELDEWKKSTKELLEKLKVETPEEYDDKEK